MVVLDTYAMLSGPAWLEAKDMWSRGCQSLVATLIAKGSERSSFTVGTISRPFGTARDPFCGHIRMRAKRE
jgi:hypothetical protein